MLLQAKDLMIGDLLTFEDCVKDGKIIPIEVVELHGYDNDFLASIDGDEICDMLEFDDEIVGIPLTPEILKKNGWLETDEPMVIFSGVGKWERKYNVFKYVHELQHALKLCGIEKQIEL